MNFAAIGTDSDILRLMEAARAAGHEIIWVGDIRPADAARVDEIVPPSTRSMLDWDHVLWELLLDRATAGGVLIGRGTASQDLRAEQLKRLVAEGVPILVSHPIVDSVLTYYELDMMRREGDRIVRHFNPLATHPMVADAAKWVRDGHPVVGAISQVSSERRIHDPQRHAVLAHLARDVEMLAEVTGSIRRVTAIGPRGDEESLAALQIQMTTDGPATLRWSLGPRTQRDTEITTTLVGELGTVALRLQETAGERPHQWSVAVVAEGQQAKPPVPDFDAAHDAMQRFAEAVTAGTAKSENATSTWSAATRAMEVVDAATLSLQKGRTMDVLQQQLTERLAFQGTMAAIGCGLLLLGFCVVVLIAMLGGIEGLAGQKFLPSWPVVMLAVLAFFLLLQGVPLLATKSQRRRPQRHE